MSFAKRIISKILKIFEIKNISTNKRVVYLTFDDGPEPGITEFVINELKKYKYRATFFCRGDNAELYPELMELIRKNQHGIGNHSYSHLHAFDSKASYYIEDVKKADEVLNTRLFRPPHGNLTLSTWMRLKSRRIVYWALNSEDSELANFNYPHAIDNLRSKTKSGDVVLFHFCHRHERETKLLLPIYLEWLYSQGYCSDVIPE